MGSYQSDRDGFVYRMALDGGMSLRDIQEMLRLSSVLQRLAETRDLAKLSREEVALVGGRRMRAEGEIRGLVPAGWDIRVDADHLGGSCVLVNPPNDSRWYDVPAKGHRESQVLRMIESGRPVAMPTLAWERLKP